MSLRSCGQALKKRCSLSSLLVPVPAAAGVFRRGSRSSVASTAPRVATSRHSLQTQRRGSAFETSPRCLPTCGREDSKAAERAESAHANCLAAAGGREASGPGPEVASTRPRGLGCECKEGRKGAQQQGMPRDPVPGWASASLAGPARPWKSQPVSLWLPDARIRAAARLCCHPGCSLLSQGACAALTSMPTTSSSPFISLEPGVAADGGAGAALVGG